MGIRSSEFRVQSSGSDLRNSEPVIPNPAIRMSAGFGLMQALMVLLIVGGMTAVAMRYARLGTVHTADSYTRERAELFLRSAQELALLQIEGYDRAAHGECLRSVHVISRDGLFTADVNITAYFLLRGSTDLTLCGERGVPVTTEESHGMVMLETVVATVPGHPAAIHPVRLVRRSLQRP